MANEDGSAWITYNGEFYDHAAWRRRLSGGNAYRGSSDTETLLHFLEERGPDALGEISGIFAFALWNARRGSLLLARDALGVKQIYYHDDGERLLFASEIKALLQDPSVRRELDPEAVNQYLHFHAPLFDRTFFRGIRQLQPGEWFEVSLGGRSRRKRYWQLDDFSDIGGSPEENVERVRSELASVVSDQLMSDVPVGAFFSAGIDSSAVAQFARRAGKPPRLFGVHFEGQGVIDEGPYQRRGAKALGLDLELITLDGSTFPEDLQHLLYHQDEPVIGAAMLPMAAVSRLAAGNVKVCLGGQAGDEIFGGYARYALAHPLRSVISLIHADRGQASGDAPAPGDPLMGGNLWRQVVDPRTIRRLIRNAGHLFDWRGAYFENFAKVPEAIWLDLFDAEGLVSRESCRHTFRTEVATSPAQDPAAKLMHWDLRTYLPGLFQQDDRMSMAASLESRVPLADPRLVRLAFRLPFNLKIRGGATKWILRQAVSDVLPREILTRRKVGFDTPAERWMKGRHSDFVRETLLSARARHRGLWKPRSLSTWLNNPDRPLWFDVIWKALSIEIWARLFLDSAELPETVPNIGKSREIVAQPPEAKAQDQAEGERASVGARLQEVRELGLAGVAFRAGWEAATRTGLMAFAERKQPAPSPGQVTTSIRRRSPFTPPAEAADAMRDRIPAEARERLARLAAQAASGQVLCFGRWLGDYGLPPDWQLNPVSGRRWTPPSTGPACFATSRGSATSS